MRAIALAGLLLVACGGRADAPGPETIAEPLIESVDAGAARCIPLDLGPCDAGAAYSCRSNGFPPLPPDPSCLQSGPIWNRGTEMAATFCCAGKP